MLVPSRGSACLGLRFSRGHHVPLARRVQALVGRCVSAYDPRMTKAAEAVLADALQLDVKARADLVAELLASLDGPSDPDAAQAWAAEIERRTKSLDAGTESLESWDEAKRRIDPGHRTAPERPAAVPRQGWAERQR